MRTPRWWPDLVDRSWSAGGVEFEGGEVFHTCRDACGRPAVLRGRRLVASSAGSRNRLGNHGGFTISHQLTVEVDVRAAAQ